MCDKFFNILYWLAALAPTAVTTFLWRGLPEEIPLRYDFYGEVTNWGSKSSLFMMPVICFMIAIIFYFIKGRAIDSVIKKSFRQLGFAIILFMNCIAFSILYLAWTQATNITEDGIKMFTAPLSLLWIVIGIQLPKLGQNRYIGIRTRYTLTDPQIWKATNTYAGKLCRLFGGVALACSLLFKGMTPFIIVISLIFATGLMSSLYSRRLHAEKTDS